jgi:hypothetical protein
VHYELVWPFYGVLWHCEHVLLSEHAPTYKENLLNAGEALKMAKLFAIIETLLLW